MESPPPDSGPEPAGPPPPTDAPPLLALPVETGPWLLGAAPHDDVADDPATLDPAPTPLNPIAPDAAISAVAGLYPAGPVGPSWVNCVSGALPSVNKPLFGTAP